MESCSLITSIRPGAVSYTHLNKDYVKFFVQEMVPAVDFDGNLLMKSEDSLAMSPNGNGGGFKSRINAGLDKDLKDKGVEWLNVYILKAHILKHSLYRAKSCAVEWCVNNLISFAIALMISG